MLLSVRRYGKKINKSMHLKKKIYKYNSSVRQEGEEKKRKEDVENKITGHFYDLNSNNSSTFDLPFLCSDL